MSNYSIAGDRDVREDPASWQYAGGLLSHHADLLRASRVPPRRAAGRYVSVDTKARLEGLGFSASAQRVPGILVRLQDRSETVIGFQYRPDNPRQATNGKPIKYETPPGQRNRIDVPIGVGDLLGDPAIPLWITEGARKADAAAELGIACVSISGVWGWRGKNETGGKVAIADFDDMALNGREVILAFDSDVMVKPSVRQALDRLAAYLENRGAKGRFLLLPDPVEGKTGLDDWIAAGGSREDLEALVRDSLPGGRERAVGVEERPRKLVATLASQIKPQRVRWLWQDRIPLGELSIIAGREGLGKSTFALHLVAQLTRGALAGEFYRTPRTVLIVATEDSWANVIVPRLMAADANLDMVLRVEVESDTGFAQAPSFPGDLIPLGELIEQHDPAMVLFDPLMSRLSAKLDSHKDGEVRQALEPLTALAQQHEASLVGLMHFNKSSTDDPMNALMGSRAFSAVARSVTVVIRHPDDPERRVFGTPKNNLGPDTLPPIGYRIVGHQYDIDSVEAWTSKVQILGAEPESISELMGRSRSNRMHTAVAVANAEAWLRDRLSSGEQPKKAVIAASRSEGISLTQLDRAAAALGVVSRRVPGYQGGTAWSLPTSGVPASSVVPIVGETIDMNEMNGTNGAAIPPHSPQSVHSSHPPSGTTPLWQDPPSADTPAPAQRTPDMAPLPVKLLPRLAPGRPFARRRLVPTCQHDGCRKPRMLGGVTCPDHLGQPLTVSP